MAANQRVQNQASPPPAPAAASRRPRLAWLAGPAGIAIVAAAAAIVAGWFSSAHHLLFLYADARSHLTIARRLIDGPNDGIVQFGTVWLPLPHAIMVPFVASMWLWHTGLAAILVGVICLVVESLSVAAIVRRLTGSRTAMWASVLLLVTNPSVLYLHTTALTEPVLFATVALTASGLVRWASTTKAFSGGEIALFCGLPAAGALLARYDGWVFVAAASGAMFAVAWRRWRNLRYAFKTVRCFVTLPLLAAGWWMWFNWKNWGDPLEFQRGPYSAQAQQELLDRQGLLPDKGHLAASLDTYTTSVLRGTGVVLVALAGVGAIYLLNRQWRERRDNHALSLAWLLPGVPFVFYVASLVTGQIVVRLETTATGGMFNLRYGIAMMTGLVVFAGFAIAGIQQHLRSRTAIVAIVAVVCGAGLWTTLIADGWRQVPVIAEGFDQRASGVDQYAGGIWLRDHAHTGVILIDDSVNPLLPLIGADLDRVVAPFSESWTTTLADPSLVQWVYIDTANPYDSVGIARRNHPGLLDAFDVVFERPGVQVLECRQVTP